MHSCICVHCVRCKLKFHLLCKIDFTGPVFFQKLKPHVAVACIHACSSDLASKDLKLNMHIGNTHPDIKRKLFTDYHNSNMLYM